MVAVKGLRFSLGRLAAIASARTSAMSGPNGTRILVWRRRPIEASFWLACFGVFARI